MSSDGDLQGRFERIREELKHLDETESPDGGEPVFERPQVPEIDHAAIDAKLDHFEHRVRQAKGGYVKAVNKPTAKALKEDNRHARSLAMGMTIAYVIIGFPMVGIGLGYLFDWHFRTHYGVAVGVLGGTTLGMILGIRMANDNAKSQS